MKNSSKVKFLHCFKHEGSPGHVFQRDRPADSEEHLTYRDIAEESSPRPHAKNGGLVRTVKAVLFKTVLARRIRERRQRGSRKIYGSINSGRTIADFLDDEVVRDDDASISQVSQLPSLYSSFDQLALSSESQNGVADLKTEAQDKSGRRRKRMICTFVVLLAAMVFLGRSWAMLLASIWICITCIYISIAHRRNKAQYKGRATNRS